MNAPLARTLRCAACGAPVEFQSPFCAYCRVPLTWGASLDVEPGRSLWTVDLRREPLPSEATFGADVTVTPEGRMLTLDGSVTFRGLMTTPPLRDACASVVATCWEPNLGFGVTGRTHTEGHAQSAYTLMVNPTARVYRVDRRLWTKTETHIEVMRNWEVTSSLAGLGAPNRVELRYADAVFQIVINGAHVASLVDARFGFGRVGWRAVSFDDLPQRKRIVLHAMEARAVA